MRTEAKYREGSCLPRMSRGWVRERRRQEGWRAGLVIAFALLAAGQARATDISVLAWGSLVGAADLVVLGTVGRVVHDGGMDIATIRIEEAFAGQAPRTVRVLVGSDPAQPRFVRGARVLALLRHPAGASGSAAPPTMEPVGGTQGVMPVSDAELASTRRWLSAMFGAGNSLDLHLLEPLLRRSEPLPTQPLFVSCLEELAARSDDGARADDDVLARMVCAEAGIYWKRARLWALEAAGRRSLREAGACVGAVAFAADADPDARLTALDAIGDAGGADTVPSLLALLGSAERSELAESAALALGKLADPAAVDGLRAAALTGDFRLASTAVHALGLIGGREAIEALADIARRQTAHVRKQAKETKRRLRRTR